MATLARNRGLPWAQGQIAAKRPGNERGTAGVRVFSAKGFSAPGTLGTAPLPQIGTPIAGTNLVYVRPRLNQDELGGTGGSPFFTYAWPGGRPVRVGSGGDPSAYHYTNPAFSMRRQYRRTPSIGMARAGQTGLTMAVPWEQETPYFSIA